MAESTTRAAVVPGIFGLLIAYAIYTAKRGNLLRQIVITASGVFANFGGVPLAFLFIATLSTTGIVTGWIKDIFGVDIWDHGFTLYNAFALRILAGFEAADSGSVAVDGKDVSRIPAAKRDMGMVFQSYSLFPNMTALDNVGFGLRMRKQRGTERGRRAAELLDMVGLTDQAKKYPHQMSGGQQQRVALARALAIEPRVLLLDEPLSALDAKVQLQLREQIRALQQRLGTTTLFVTHDQEEALSIADRVGVMKDGRLEQVAEPSQLYDQPATAFVAEFVGTMNRIPGELQGSHDVSALGAVVPVHGDTASGLSGDVDVLVRPEGLKIAVQSGGNGIVTHKTFLGSVTRVSVLLSGDVTVKVDLPSTVAPRCRPAHRSR